MYTRLNETASDTSQHFASNIPAIKGLGYIPGQDEDSVHLALYSFQHIGEGTENKQAEEARTTTPPPNNATKDIEESG